MDFTLTDDQQAIADLSARILADGLPLDRLRAMDTAGDWGAPDLWAALARADLLGIALPEAVGGGGYGMVEACLVAEQIGRRVAPLPYVPCIVGAAMTLAEHGTAAQQERLLPGTIDGTQVVTVALHEAPGVTVPEVPTTSAQRDGDGWRLHGELAFVSAAGDATAILLPARTTDTATTVFLVADGSEGLELVEQRAVTGEPQWIVRLDGVAVGRDDVVGEVDHGAALVADLVDRLTVATCATQVGVCEEALALTAAHVSEREQFGTKLGTFQAVAQRAADAYIDTEAVRLTTLHAAWRLGEGLPADREVAVAKFWAADGAQRVVHAAQHLHGGVGVDTDHAIHRYFRWAKVLELSLGGASASLLRLGAALAAEPAGT
jgi:3-oxocholest-4-en-26-oyl-CoA dehydrogenase beta subunit